MLRRQARSDKEGLGWGRRRENQWLLWMNG